MNFLDTGQLGFNLPNGKAKPVKVQRQHRTRKELTDQEVFSILSEAKKESFFDYVALRTMAELGIRRASLVGQNDHRSNENPGMLIENLTHTGIYIYEKKKTEKVFKVIKPELRTLINQLIGKKTSGSIFPRTTGWVWYRIRHYAQKAGISDWQYVHPHALRWWSGDTVFEQHGIKAASNHLGHKNVATTWSHYTHKVKPEVMSAASQTLEDKFEGL